MMDLFTRIDPGSAQKYIWRHTIDQVKGCGVNRCRIGSNDVTDIRANDLARRWVTIAASCHVV